MTRQRLEFLLRLLKTNDLTESQWTELSQAFNDDELRDLLTADILQSLKEKSPHESWTPASEKEVWDNIVSSTSIQSDSFQSDPIESDSIQKETTVAPIYHIPVRRIPVWRGSSVAAAAAILIISIATYLFISNNKSQKPTVAQTPAPTDIKAPQTNRATITLAGGQTLFLDSAANGQLALQNNVKLIKTAGGTISYDGSSQLKSTALIYNTLANPRGSKNIAMTLSDGTKIWLNAGSSLTYPVAFTGHERNVEITGEAYFEVARNPSMPFTVKKSNSDTKIQVLGTHFNVNAYDDEASIKVTLLEGSVKVSNGNKNSIIKPGQQAIIKTSVINGSEINNAEIKVSSDVDTEEVMAWTTGFFQFNQLDLQSIMRQVARWYDLDITYETQVKPDRFGGRLSKDLPLSDILKSLEANGNGVKFRLEGKKLFVQ